ncbi:hypothetical protein GCM10011316_08420 [Roseibium aquae]|uniref:BioF2-like acetyltransferase domain-containing protein n=1 Tax=Roseibium aquae TaxID=1323746 RepID=A0A916WWU2_9HYPH|nr:GNAT family N-acetyltransferase [Roseibium aquae]GGB38702.1 hypothetical protein GCM10011316_08420 [Roseibium aquae]
MNRVVPALAPPLEAAIVSPLSAAGDVPAWRALTTNSTDPNPFFGPDFLMPFLENMRQPPVRLAVVRNASTGTWLAAAPVGRRRLGLAVPAATSWATEYSPLGSPLIHRDTNNQVVGLLLDTMSEAAGSPLVAFPYLPLDSSTAARLLTTDLTWRWSLAHEASRAAHSAGAHGEAQFAEAFSGKKRKELMRQMRRLADLGEIELSSTQGKAGVPAFECFLELEARGWKGRSGTALKMRRETEDFARQMIATRAAHGGIRIDQLLLDGRPIAMLVLLREGSRIFSWKIAYDEAFSKYSPGTQIALYAMEKNLRDDELTGADSLAVPGHHMIEPLWRGRLPTATLLLSKSRSGHFLMKAGQMDVDLEKSARAAARRWLKRKD